MAIFGNSTQVTSTGWKKGNLEEFKAKQACKQELGEYASPNEIQACIDKKLNQTKPKNHEELITAQKESDQKGKKTTVASPQEWSESWKQKQVEQHKQNVRKEDHSDPTPLLNDKIGSLPQESARRRNAEVLKSTLDNSTSGVGYGPDALNKESYREIKRLVKSSEMLQQSTNQQQTPGKNEMVGVEEGKPVSNLQNWRVSIANAIQPISDALGSHADVNSYIIKNPLGPVQFLPQAALLCVNEVASIMVSSVENAMKVVQKALLVQLPQKIAGSLRHITTAASKALAFAFDLVSDVYNGLMSLINKVSKLIDTIVNKIVNFAISAIGGLIDAVIPPWLLKIVKKLVSKIIKGIHTLSSMLGGFSALAKIAAQILDGLPLGCTGNVFDINKINTKGLDSAISKARAVGAVVGTIPGLGAGLGNLGFSINGKINFKLGALTANIGDPTKLLLSMFDKKIAALLKKLPMLCNVGMVGNEGFSVGVTFDGLTNHSFSIAMTKYATHASIISGNFNKKSTPVGSYAKENYFNMFDGLPFDSNSQGNKGLVMHGPGGTAGKKIFRL